MANNLCSLGPETGNWQQQEQSTSHISWFSYGHSEQYSHSPILSQFNAFLTAMNKKKA